MLEDGLQYLYCFLAGMILGPVVVQFLAVLFEGFSLSFGILWGFFRLLRFLLVGLRNGLRQSAEEIRRRERSRRGVEKHGSS